MATLQPYMKPLLLSPKLCDLGVDGDARRLDHSALAGGQQMSFSLQLRNSTADAILVSLQSYKLLVLSPSTPQLVDNLPVARPPSRQASVLRVQVQLAVRFVPQEPLNILLKVIDPRCSALKPS